MPQIVSNIVASERYIAMTRIVIGRGMRMLCLCRELHWEGFIDLCSSMKTHDLRLEESWTSRIEGTLVTQILSCLLKFSL